MFRKKIVIYVEGQTEQILINHLIKIRWNYNEIKIRNIKLQSYQNVVCRIQDFLPDIDDESAVLFLIIDVDGVGSLPSAIANRANNQLKEGFEIIALRDLSAEDFHEFPSNVDRVALIIQKFKEALHLKRCEQFEKIDLFFAVMTIEAWMLACTASVSAWAKVSEEDVLKQFVGISIEEIKSPSTRLELIGKAREKNPKSLGEVLSFASNITADEIKNVYDSCRVPNFNKFWDKLILLSS